MFAALQRAFTDALADPDRAVPDDIAACHADAAVRRFNIYRNNVTVGLLDALAARFPVTRQIVGEDFFKCMARLFIAEHPPSSPLMMFYGDSFPDFIASFEAASDLAYLADVARLEAARTRAFHAQDAIPLEPSALRSVSAEDLGVMHVKLHPSMEIVSSTFPIVTIFAMHTGDIPLEAITDWHGETALIVRPQFDICIRCLPPGGASFLQVLNRRQSLTEAVEAAVAGDPDFDLGVNLALLFSAGLAVSLSIVSPEDLSP
jgi:hypothetical protein